MFTVTNTIILAVMQVGVIVAGALAAGLCHRLFAGMSFPMPWPAQLLYSYGVAGFLIPLTWSAIALVAERSSLLSDDAKQLAFLCGIIILVTLILFVLYADVTPWMGVMWSLGGDED